MRRTATVALLAIVASCCGDPSVNATGLAPSRGGSDQNASPPWLTARRARAASLAGHALPSEWFNEFGDTSGVVKVVGGGTPTAIPSQSVKGGVLRVTSVSNPGYCAVIPAGQGPLIVNPTSDEIYAYWRVWFEGPMDAFTSTKVGLTSATAPISGVGSGSTYFGIGSTGFTGGSATKFVVETFDGTSDPLVATTTDVDTALFHDVELYSNGTTGKWYFDGSLVSATTTMANVGGRPMTIDVGRVYGTSTSHSISVDKAYVSFFSTAEAVPIRQADWLDSAAWDPVSTVQPGIYSPNLAAVLPLHVNAGQRTLNLTGWTTSIGGGLADFGVGIFIDGAYATELTAPANGFTSLGLALDGAAHDIDVISAYQNYHTPSTNVGTWLTGYQGATIRVVAAPSRRVAFYGDSVMGGAYASPITRYGWFALTRAYYPGRISCECYGGRELVDDATGINGGFANVTALAARLVALVQQGGAATTRIIWLEIGYNDWHNNTYSAANFQTVYASLLVAIHAADPAAAVFAQTPIITGSEATTNGFGETIAQIRTAVTSAASGKSYVTVVAGPSLAAPGALAPDGIHLSTAGHSSVFDGSGGFAGSTNVRAILNF